VVLDSSIWDGLVPVSSVPSPLISPFEHESALASLEASLKPEGPILDPVHLFPGISSSGANQVGERLRLSCPLASSTKCFRSIIGRPGKVVL
jgi:hypothetical protein